MRARLESAGARVGDPILQLPPASAHRQPWSSNSQLLAKAPEPEAILYGEIDEDDHVFFVRLDGKEEAPRSVLEALDRWRPVLATRAEIARNPRREWWETAWPRDARDLASPKVIAVHRTNRGRFALDEAGSWKPGKTAAVIVPRKNESVAYLCGLLNSELLDLWYAVRGRHPRDIWRDYEPKPMAEIPFRRPDTRANRVAKLVREIAATRRALLPHRSVVRDLARIIKDPWKEGPVVIDRASFVAEVPVVETVSVRLDKKLEAGFSPGAAGRPERESPGALVFRRGKSEVGRVTGDSRRLELLQELVGGKARDDVSDLLLPIDLDRFERQLEERAKLVEKLLGEGRRLVEEVERLVCALYGLPDELAEEVVEHAASRTVRPVS